MQKFFGEVRKLAHSSIPAGVFALCQAMQHGMTWKEWTLSAGIALLSRLVHPAATTGQ